MEIFNPTIEAAELTGKGIVLDVRVRNRATIDGDRVEKGGSAGLGADEEAQRLAASSSAC